MYKRKFPETVSTNPLCKRLYRNVQVIEIYEALKFKPAGGTSGIIRPIAYFLYEADAKMAAGNIGKVEKVRALFIADNESMWVMNGNDFVGVDVLESFDELSP